MSTRPSSFAAQVVRWQKAHGRHDLPWQNTHDSYRIWLSEIMLQQTQVATVAPYYLRFLQRFPNLATLAAAELDDVLQMWSGLGYYSRARNLHRAARDIRLRHGGRFPCSYDEVLALPGIGRSTAAAICVFAFGARHAILDGNVKRLLARYFGIAGYPGDPQVAAQLWRTAENELATRDCVAYTQGLMDLGAEVCVRGRPRCDICPMAADCVAHRSGRIQEFPAPRPRKVLPQRRTCMLVMLHGGKVLLEKRVASGIWGGLWSLPEVEAHADIGDLCEQRYGAQVAAHHALPRIEHTFTHFKLAIEPRCVSVACLKMRAAVPAVIWLPVGDALAAAIPAPVRRILSAV